MEGVSVEKDVEGSKITIIDDEKSLVETIREFLEARNFTVSFAYDGHSGLDVIRKEKPDLVVLDIAMPKMNGRVMFLELRNDERIKNIPVIMLSAKVEPFDVAYGMEIGAAAYLTKPCTMERLLEQINDVLYKRKTEGF